MAMSKKQIGFSTAGMSYKELRWQKRRLDFLQKEMGRSFFRKNIIFMHRPSFVAAGLNANNVVSAYISTKKNIQKML